jgi:hypothetical protein
MIAVINGRVGCHLAFLPADGFLSKRKRGFETITTRSLVTLSQEQDEGE